MESLTEAQIDTLHQALLALKAEIEADLASTAGDDRPVDLGLPIGRLSRMDAIQQQHMSRAGRSAYVRRLSQVETALETVAGGSYGECRSCGDPIALARLTARPETPFCLPCQEELEAR